MDKQEIIDRGAMYQEFLKEFEQGLSWFERWLWKQALGVAEGGVRIIWNRDSTEPYLLRIYLYRTKTWGVYLHHFFRSDGDREVHNHPADKAVSLILTKGYLEHRWNPLRHLMEEIDVKPWAINWIDKNDFHRVELVRGRCWTLFVRGQVPPQDGYDWGFLDVKTGHYTPWGEYVEKTDG